MADFKVVRMQDGSELLQGGQYRNYVRAEVMVGTFGPFFMTVEKGPGWEIELRRLIDEQVRHVQSLAS